MTITYTTTFRFAKPDFRSPGWAAAIDANFDAIDAALRNILMNVVPWSNALNVKIGQVVLDTVANPTAFWICNVTHTTIAGPGTFAQERVANPTYWNAFSFGIKSRGAWVNNTAYFVNDIAYDSVRGITGIVNIAHTSNVSGSIQDDAANWSFIVNLPTVFTALATNYDNSTSHLVATNVQTAIDAVQASVAGAYISSNITYDHTISGLASTNVKAAIDELRATQVADEANITANTANIAAGLIATGFPMWRPTIETLAGWITANGLTIGNGVSGATGRANADCAALYAWHWNNFSNTQCPVSTGRGANAAADFAASKTITVLDLKGTGPIGMDTMGGAASTRLTSVPVVSGNATTAGSVLGENLHTSTLAETPTGITSSNLASIALSVTSGSSTIVTNSAAITSSNSGTGGTFGQFTNSGSVAMGSIASSGTIPIGNAPVTSNNTSGGAHNNVHRIMTGTWYLKL